MGLVRVSITQGDITDQRVDAVVNAANRAMRGGGGVDGAIHRAGGPEVLAECVRRFPDGLPTGGAGWTSAGRLPARWVIHVVGPNYTAGERDPAVLASCYRGAVRIADELDAATLALPAVSAGVYGWPLQDAARIAVRTVRATVAELGEATSLLEARFVLFSRDVVQAFRAALEEPVG